MSDIITGLRQVIQDLEAREFKAHAIKLDALQRQSESLQKTLDAQHDSLMKTLAAFRAEMRSEFAACKQSA